MILHKNTLPPLRFLKRSKWDPNPRKSPDKPVLLRHEHASETSTELFKTHEHTHTLMRAQADCWTPLPETDLVGPGRGLGICIINRLPGDSDTALCRSH